MAYAYDKDLEKWVVLLDDIVIDTAESEEEAKLKNERGILQ